MEFEIYEGAGGHLPGEIVLIDYEHGVAFTGDVYVNMKGFTKEQAEYNRCAPVLMTSVDTDPQLAARERGALMRRLGAGEWRIFGGHGQVREYGVAASDVQGGVMLSIEGASVNYGALRALRGADMCVRGGEITALIGMNGAGKTTLLSAAMGVTQLVCGRVLFMGEDITRMDALARIRRGLALCPEGRQVFARMSVAENLRMGGYTLPRREVKPRMEQLLEMFPRLGARLNQQAGTLSGGEQQWLAIARALMSRPKLLMMDEPTLGLAPEAVDELFEMLRGIAASGVTLLVVEQDVGGVLSVAGDVYALEGGVCRLLGRAQALACYEDFRREWLADE